MGGWETIEVAGAPVRCHVAGAEGAGTPGVLLLHAWWGLGEDIRAYADRLGAAGLRVLAPDLYGGIVVETVEDAERMSGSLDEATADAITMAALDALVARAGPEGRVATLGFSMGVPWALWAPGRRPSPVRATIVYYGTVGGPVLERSDVPVLGHFAADDPYEPEESVTAFEAALRAAGRDVTIHRYPATGHWFAEQSREAFVPDAAELAFARTLAFLRRHLGPDPG